MVFFLCVCLGGGCSVFFFLFPVAVVMYYRKKNPRQGNDQQN